MTYFVCLHNSLKKSCKLNDKSFFILIIKIKNVNQTKTYNKKIERLYGLLIFLQCIKVYILNSESVTTKLKILKNILDIMKALAIDFQEITKIYARKPVVYAEDRAVRTVINISILNI